MKKFLIILLILIFSTTFVACNQSSDTDNVKMIIAVGVVPEATFVKEIAGDLVEVVTMIPPGNSPANYQPSAREMEKFSDAVIYFTMQMPTEEANILPIVNDFNSEMIVVNLREVVSATYDLVSASAGHEEDEDDDDDDHDHGDVDPHLWLSPKRAIVMVETIAEQLSLLDESNRELFMTNAAAYIEKINQLDEDIVEKTSNLNNKTFLIYHGSYAYYADDYGLTMLAIEIEGKQATASEMQNVIDMAIANNIKTIFYQEEFDDLQAKTIASEIDGDVVQVSPLSENYIESLMQFTDALKN